MLHKLLFPQYEDADWGYLNLENEARKSQVSPINPLLDPAKCEDWVDSLHCRDKLNFSYGGYLEDRAHLWRDHYHFPGRTVHVGVDYNVPAGAWVSMPADGHVVLVEEDPDQNGGWGTRAIYKIGELYVTFAHLCVVYVNGPVDRLNTIYKGTKIGIVGPSERNGGWYPHLHVQREYKPFADAYVAFSKELSYEYPNPEILERHP